MPTRHARGKADALLRVAQHRSDQRDGACQLAGVRRRVREVSRLHVHRRRKRHLVDAPAHVAYGQEFQGAALDGAWLKRLPKRIHPGARAPDDPAHRGAGEPRPPAPDLRDDRGAPNDPVLSDYPHWDFDNPEDEPCRRFRRNGRNGSSGETRRSCTGSSRRADRPGLQIS